VKGVRSPSLICTHAPRRQPDGTFQIDPTARPEGLIGRISDSMRTSTWLGASSAAGTVNQCIVYSSWRIGVTLPCEGLLEDNLRLSAPMNGDPLLLASFVTKCG